MSLKPNRHREFVTQLPRLLGGLALGFLLYYAAHRYATVDCQTFQFTIRAGGIFGAAKVIGILILVLSTGTSTAVAALLAGLAAGPMIGAPLASISVVLSSAIFWYLGRILAKNALLPESVSRYFGSSPWFQTTMDHRSTSGFRWTLIHSMNAPVNFTIFAFLIGAKIPHLSFVSMLAGIFSGSVLHVAGYSLAGASIGCAVVNHALGLPFEEYRTMMLVSCFILLLLSRLHALIHQRSSL